MLILKKIKVERYKGYSQPCTFEIKPLTILVGKNNSGKSALARVAPLIAGGFVFGENDTGPLPLRSFGLKHGQAFPDIITGKTPHGRANFALSLTDEDRDLTLDFTVQNVSELGNPKRQIVDRWILDQPDGQRLSLHRKNVDEDVYRVVFENRQEECKLSWQGLIPYPITNCVAFSQTRYKSTLDKLKEWSKKLRYLVSPRELKASPFPVPEVPPAELGVNGREAPLVLAASEAIMEKVNEWFREAFKVKLSLRYEVSRAYLEVASESSISSVDLLQAGQGLSHVLPVVVQLLLANEENSSLNVIEHPEAEIHPNAHTAVADLIVESLNTSPRPVIIETHSEELLLRVRRKIAEGTLSADSVAVYWIECEVGEGASARKIEITPDGEVNNWPEGVFLESYEEVIAIRRAARNRNQK